MSDCIMLLEGDKLYYRDRLCEVTQLGSDGVMVRDGAVSRYIFATDISTRNFVYRIEFTKGKFSGYESTPSKEKALKEKAFLEEMGWTVKITQTEVK